MQRVRSGAIAALAVVSAVGPAVGCGSASETEPHRARADRQRTERAVYTTPPGPAVAPLLGTATDDAAVATRPAVIVKVDNRADARPQVGLGEADIVFEELTEGGITRFLAVYQSRLPHEVGPIRSVRAIDPGLAAAIGGVFAYSGGTPPNVAAIERAPVLAVDETRARRAMYRAKDRRAPHNLFGDPARLNQLAPAGTPPPPALFEYGSVAAASEPCTTLVIAFSTEYTSRYDWATETSAWRRSTGGQPFVSSGAQIAPTNVVVIWLRDQSAEATVGSGDALVARDGMLQRGRWTRTSVADGFDLTDALGVPMLLAPGTAWVHLAIVDDTVVQACVPS